MNVHPTKYHGDIAVAKTISDLVEKGWFVFTPTVSEHCKTDLIAYREKDKSGKPEIVRIQCKYGHRIIFKTYTIIKGNEYHTPYKLGDFDFYANYIPEVDKVCYIPLKFALESRITYIRYYIKDNNGTPFWWYEDFLDILYEERKKKSFRDFGIKLNINHNHEQEHHYKHPSKEKLQILIWKFSKEKIGEHYGVSGNSIKKLVKKYDLILPPFGYFQMSQKRAIVFRKEAYKKSSDDNFREFLRYGNHEKYSYYK